MPAPMSSPLRSAVLAQVVGAVVMGGLQWGAPQEALSAFTWTLVQGGCAALVAMWLGMPRWWWLISLLFVPLAWLAQGLDLPSWLWFAGFVLLFLVFWRTDSSRVPLYMTNATSAGALAHLLPPTACRFVDLGCGDGRLLRHLARQRPDSEFVGYEHAPLTWLWAWLLGRGLPNLDIRFGSFWAHDLGSYDWIYAFLSPVPMPSLWEKARSEMKQGARLVSNSFAVPDVEPLQLIQVEDSRHTRLLVYSAACAGQ